MTIQITKLYNIALRLIQNCVIIRIHLCSRVGQSNARVKCVKLENSLSYCILLSSSGRAFIKEGS